MPTRSRVGLSNGKMNWCFSAGSLKGVVLTKQKEEAFPAEGAAGANMQSLWVGGKASFVGTEGRGVGGSGNGNGSRKSGGSRPDCNIIFVPCYRPMSSSPT